MNAREERDLRIAAEQQRTLDWVFNELIPQAEQQEKEEAPEADVDSVRFLHPPVPKPRKVRIGDEVFDVRR